MFWSVVYNILHCKTYWLRREMMRRQWFEATRLQSLCDRLTQQLAEHANNTVPYYRSVFAEHDIDIANQQFAEYWPRIPILEKSVLQSEYGNLKSRLCTEKQSYENHTGGSTGSPVRFLTDWHQYNMMVAWLDFVYGWCGWQPGEPRLYLWGNDGINTLPTMVQRIRARAVGRFVIPVYSYQEEDLDRWFQTLQIVKPTVLYGYPSVLADFSDWLIASGKSYCGLKGVYSSAEILYPHQRSRIEECFGCKVFNQYGSREAPCIGCECEHGKMHLFIDINRIELDGEDGVQDFIVTPLYNYAQPLLRYRLGDAGKMTGKSCACGRQYPILDLELARARDFLFGMDGRKFYPGFFTRLMDRYSWVRSFQFRQTAVDEIRLFVVAADEHAARGGELLITSEILPVIRNAMGEKMQLTVKVVDQLQRTGASKHRYVINEMQKP